MEELRKIGIYHYSIKKSDEDDKYCGWCKHTSLKDAPNYLGNWYLQSRCSKNDMVPVSEFCHCKDFERGEK